MQHQSPTWMLVAKSYSLGPVQKPFGRKRKVGR